MKSLFKKNTPDNSQKNPELPKAKKDESNADGSMVSYFRDLARKKTAPTVRNADDPISRKYVRFNNY